MVTSPIFTAAQKCESGRHSSVLPVLTSSGNLLAGATTRIAVGFALNPFSVLSARYEVRTLSYVLHHMLFMTPEFLCSSVEQSLCVWSLTSSMLSIVRAGPLELFRGFLASSLRDAPDAGLFLVFYEAIKRDAASILPQSSSLICAA